MNITDKTLESKTRVQYHDCDPFNHLNNSRYIDYMMGARSEQLMDNYGFNTAEIAASQGLGWVAANTQISYFHPAAWMELITIETRLIEFSESSLVIEALMWDEHKLKLKSLMWTKLVHFNISTQRSHRHNEDLMKLFHQVCNPPENITSYEARVRLLRLNRSKE